MIEAGVPSTGGWVVPAPPWVVILAPPRVPCNVERAQCKGAALGKIGKLGSSAAKGIIEAGARKPRPYDRSRWGRTRREAATSQAVVPATPGVVGSYSSSTKVISTLTL
jgi:hypothetical protein